VRKVPQLVPSILSHPRPNKDDLEGGKRRVDVQKVPKGGGETQGSGKGDGCGDGKTAWTGDSEEES
jgi:hypothetical protein